MAIKDEQKDWEELQQEAKKLLDYYTGYIQGSSRKRSFDKHIKSDFASFLQQIHESKAIYKYILKMYIRLFEFEEKLNIFLGRKLQYAFIDENTKKYILIENATLIDMIRKKISIGVQSAKEHVGRISNLKIAEDDSRWTEVTFPYYLNIMHRIRQEVGQGEHQKHVTKEQEDSFYAIVEKEVRKYSPAELKAGDINLHVINYVLAAANIGNPDLMPVGGNNNDDKETFIYNFIIYLQGKKHMPARGITRGDVTFNNGVLNFAVKGNFADLEGLNPGLKVAFFITQVSENPFKDDVYQEQLETIARSSKFTTAVLKSDSLKEEIEKIRKKIAKY